MTIQEATNAILDYPIRSLGTNIIIREGEIPSDDNYFFITLNEGGPQISSVCRENIAELDIVDLISTDWTIREYDLRG